MQYSSKVFAALLSLGAVEAGTMTITLNDIGGPGDERVQICYSGSIDGFPDGALWPFDSVAKALAPQFAVDHPSLPDHVLWFTTGPAYRSATFSSSVLHTMYFREPRLVTAANWIPVADEGESLMLDF